MKFVDDSQNLRVRLRLDEPVGELLDLGLGLLLQRRDLGLRTLAECLQLGGGECGGGLLLGLGLVAQRALPGLDGRADLGLAGLAEFDSANPGDPL